MENFGLYGFGDVIDYCLCVNGRDELSTSLLDVIWFIREQCDINSFGVRSFIWDSDINQQ